MRMQRKLLVAGALALALAAAASAVGAAGAGTAGAGGREVPAGGACRRACRRSSWRASE